MIQSDFSRKRAQEALMPAKGGLPSPRRRERQEGALAPQETASVREVVKPDGSRLALVVEGVLSKSERDDWLAEVPLRVKAYAEEMPRSVLSLTARLSEIHRQVDTDTIPEGGHNRITVLPRIQIGRHRDTLKPGTWVALGCLRCSERGMLLFTELGLSVEYAEGDAVVFDATEEHESGHVCDEHVNATAFSRGREPTVEERMAK